MTRSLILLSLLLADAISLAAEPVAIGSRRELFVDDSLVEHLTGKADLRLHQPTPQNVALTTNEPWEGNGTNYVTVFQDGEKYRMYYRGSHYSYLEGKDRPNTRDLYCYAESSDGINWTKPELGIFDWNGSTQNNIVWDGVGAMGSRRSAKRIPTAHRRPPTRRWEWAVVNMVSMRFNRPTACTGR